ncbi:MAG: mercuric reductase [Prochlorotrichaceae cyanobacterium]|jgi:pyruvate/2-oxoglutarate dehydrogenase complex dihydrolipoamide dehydrogenase (E3) component
MTAIFSIRDFPPVQPLDRYNEQLIAHLHPQDWVPPTPQACYDLVIIGAGPAGLVTAAGAAGLGAKVALIERHLMGGDCLNVGCVPSKCLLSSAHAVGALQRAGTLGVTVADYNVEFAAVMERLRRIRASISHHDSVQRFQALGVDVFLGSGTFLGENRVQVGDSQLRFKKAVITTGARPRIPEIAGLAETGYLTNETVFSLTTCPPSLAVIGAGPIGCELAQAFQHLGAQVILFHNHDRLLNRENPDAALIVQKRLAAEGVQLILGAEIEEVGQDDQGLKTITYRSQGQSGTVTVSEILVGAGRSPNVEGLNLEAVGVAYDRKRGIQVNDVLQTTNPRIYAAGDICLDWKFTHAADAAARIVIKNTLFSPFGLGRYKLSSLVIPRCTYTSPEIAQVGLSEAEIQRQGLAVDSFKIALESNDRAVATGETEGFVQIQVQKGTDKIIGATIVAERAGDLINEITLAMVHNIGLGGISSVIHPYPTQGEIIRKAADAYRRTLLTPRSLALLKFLLRLS